MCRRRCCSVVLAVIVDAFVAVADYELMEVDMNVLERGPQFILPPVGTVVVGKLKLTELGYFADVVVVADYCLMALDLNVLERGRRFTLQPIDRYGGRGLPKISGIQCVSNVKVVAVVVADYRLTVVDLNVLERGPHFTLQPVCTVVVDQPKLAEVGASLTLLPLLP